MGRLIRDQPIASTALDRHGEQLSEAELRHLFSQIPNERFLNLNHDLTRPPVARAYNNRLEQRGDVLAIVSDIEVLDEAALDGAGATGFSISYHRMLPTTDPGAERVVVSFNPRSVNREVIEEAVSSAELPRGSVLVSERADKALVAVFAIIYVISHGFFDEAGADIYRLWKELAKRALGLDKPAQVVLRSPADDDLPEVLVKPDLDADVDALQGLDVRGLIDEARRLSADGSLVRVVIEVDADGRSRLEVAVDGRGLAHSPERPTERLPGEPEPVEPQSSEPPTNGVS